MKFKQTIILVFLLFGVACAKQKLAYDLAITHSLQSSSKGTILLIHGAAPLNKDGRIPVEADIVYAKTTLYKDLAAELNSLGWDVARYSKYGVYDDHIDYELYKKTDVALIVKQLKEIWGKLPRKKPLIVFAASEGTLHAHQLSLQEAQAVILLGAVATNIGDVFLDQATSEQEKIKIRERLSSAYQMKRDDMWGKSHPAGRVVDELNMSPNWTYYERCQNIPMLVLHGEMDEEVKLYQSTIWKEKLPKHDITTVIRPYGNHTFGVGETMDAPYLAKTINEWLEKTLNQAL